MRIVIGHIALLEKDKRQETVIRAVNVLISKGIDCFCLFVGKERNDENGYLNYLKNLVKELGLEEKVKFLGYRNDVPDILKILDIAIIPASFEGFPLAGLEANAAGVPVVACNIGGAEEFVRIGKSGEVFKFDDFEDLANKIIQVFENRDFYSSNALKFSRSCSTQSFSKQIMTIFRSI